MSTRILTRKRKKIWYDWSNLPIPAVEKIYSYLNRKDQYSMSLVCCSWSRGFNSPTVLSRMKFILNTEKLPDVLYQEIKKAVKYNNFVQHIEIVCGPMEYVELYSMHAYLRKYLLALMCTQKQFLSISLVNFKELFKFIRKYETNGVHFMLSRESGCTYQCICEQFIGFLSHQQEAKTIELIDCDFELQEAVKVLRVVSNGKSPNQRSLKLRGFLSRTAALELQRIETKDFLPIYSLVYLKELDIDYGRLFEAFVSGLQHHRQKAIKELLPINNVLLPRIMESGGKGDLCRIKLHCYLPSKERCTTISNDAWTYLNENCPTLSVDINLRAGSMLKTVLIDEVEKIIVQNMPLRCLHLAIHKQTLLSHEEMRFLIENKIKKGIEVYTIK